MNDFGDIWLDKDPSAFVERVAAWLDELPYGPSDPIYVCICGGREFRDVSVLNVTMARIRMERPIAAVITGGQRGADKMGTLWGMTHRFPTREINARWKAQGRAAGPIRNGKLVEALLLQKCPVVVALPGETGTHDMIVQSRQAGIPVLDIEDILDRL